MRIIQSIQSLIYINVLYISMYLYHFIYMRRLHYLMSTSSYEYSLLIASFLPHIYPSPIRSTIYNHSSINIIIRLINTYKHLYIKFYIIMYYHKDIIYTVQVLHEYHSDKFIIFHYIV